MKSLTPNNSGIGSKVQQPVAQIQKVQQLVGQIPWGHNVLVISKVKSLEEAEFYLKETITQGCQKSKQQRNEKE